MLESRCAQITFEIVTQNRANPTRIHVWMALIDPTLFDGPSVISNDESEVLMGHRISLSSRKYILYYNMLNGLLIAVVDQTRRTYCYIARERLRVTDNAQRGRQNVLKKNDTVS